jgi:hypothetical protein
VLHGVDVGNVTDITHVYAVSISDPVDGCIMYLRMLASSSTTTWCKNKRKELTERSDIIIMIQAQWKTAHLPNSKYRTSANASLNSLLDVEWVLC